MKRIFSLTLAALFGVALLVSCTRKTIGQEPKTIDDLNGKVFGLLVSPVVITPVQIQEMYGFLPSEVKSFLTFNELLAALKSKRVDAIYSAVETGRYIMTADDTLNVISGINSNYGLRMLMRDTDTELLRDINSAIAELELAGILDEIYEKYITNATVNTMAAALAEIPQIEGADIILVGINGDFPPFDYVSADGKPSGYNVALAAEISRVLGRNLSFVTIPTDARFSALLSKNSRRMDVFFWYYGALDVDGLALTDPYTNMSDCVLVRK
jgi:polar amino acid transport system substrate-binding protein